MKKIKFIPVLAMAALLSACEMGGPSVKAPKFAKEGNKVEAEKFIEDASKVMSELDVSQENPTYQDKLITVKLSYSDEIFIKRGNTKISQQSGAYVYNMSYGFDVDTKVALGKTELNAKQTKKDQTTNSSTTEKAKQEVYLQKFSHDGKAYFGMVTPKEKEMEGYAELNETVTEEKVFNSFVANAEDEYLYLSECAGLFTQYPLMPDEEKAKFAFYENGNVYTVTYTTESESDEENYKKKLTSTIKYQYEIKGNDVTFRMSQEELTVYDYKKSYSAYPYAHVEGDHEEEKTAQYIESSAKTKKVSYNAVDTTGFAFEFDA